ARPQDRPRLLRLPRRAPRADAVGAALSNCLICWARAVVSMAISSRAAESKSQSRCSCGSPARLRCAGQLGCARPRRATRHDDLAATGSPGLVTSMVGARHELVDPRTLRADRGHADTGADPTGFAVMLEAEVADGSDDRPG